MEREEIAAVNIFMHVHKLGPRYFMLYIILKSHTCKMLTIHKFKGGSRTGAPPSRLKKSDLFCKFSLYIRKYFDFSQHAVFTICILFTTLLTKT